MIAILGYKYITYVHAYISVLVKLSTVAYVCVCILTCPQIPLQFDLFSLPAA